MLRNCMEDNKLTVSGLRQNRFQDSHWREGGNDPWQHSTWARLCTEDDTHTRMYVVIFDMLRCRKASEISHCCLNLNQKNTRHVMFLLLFVRKKQFPETQSVTLKSRWSFTGNNQKTWTKASYDRRQSSHFFSLQSRSVASNEGVFFCLFYWFCSPPVCWRWMPYLPFSTLCPSFEVVARIEKRTDGGKEGLRAKCVLTNPGWIYLQVILKQVLFAAAWVCVKCIFFPTELYF